MTSISINDPDKILSELISVNSDNIYIIEEIKKYGSIYSYFNAKDSNDTETLEFLNKNKFKSSLSAEIIYKSKGSDAGNIFQSRL